ncbi:hypothetical protein FS837_000535 [Tulasnella sp. UAMH 9824]|nr:hypothetical protein FS837_000535 [Tulasnella sp. UAMH 9824]
MSSTVAETNMSYTRLGKSGLKGLYELRSPEWQGWVLGEEEGLKHIKTAYDLGITAFDTANWYSNGLLEVILGKAIKKYNLPRDEIVVMTKLYATVSRDLSEHSLWGQSINELGRKRYSNQQGLSRKALNDVVKAGYVRYIVHKMHNYARAHGLTEFISMQNLHNATYREEEREMIPLLQDLGVGMIPWSPLAAGFLTRSYKEQTLRGNTDS